jgi:hypothetical protein
MSVEGPSHPEPDESAEREQAERLLANVSELVLFLVGGYASEILAHLPIALPPGITGDINSLSVVHETMMAWATEAVEHPGQREEHGADSEAVRVVNFERLIELGRQDIQVRAGLDSARRSVEEAALQLASARPNTKEWYRAKQVLEEAIKRLLEASTRLMKLDAVRAAATEPVENLQPSNRDIFASRFNAAEASLGPKADPVAEEAPSVEDITRLVVRGPASTDDNRDIDKTLRDLDERIKGVDPPDPTPGQGAIGPTSL